MKEKLSAFIDGEGEGDIHSQLGRLRAEPELRAAWDTYHLIGDALRGHPGPEIASRVISRLREEPTVLAPLRTRSTVKRLGRYSMYAAASAAAVAIVAWTAFPAWHESQPVGGNLATTDAPSENLVVNEDVENYLLAHQPYSHVSAMQGVAPYVRSVAEERGVAGQ
jgi:sigma-E factor negative regulatory protein RseA